MSNEEHESPEEVEVRLRPVLGIAPATWVPVAYGLLTALVLFFVLVYPGIRHHGSLVTFVTTPERVSIRVDGTRLGTAPGTYFVRSGERELELARPGFQTHRETIRVEGRRLGSWIVPRRRTLRVNLESPDPASLAGAAAVEFSSWSLAGEASGQYQFPPIARALASDLRATAAADPSASSAAWEAFAEAALPQVVSEALLNDLAAGALSLGGDTPVAVPAGIAGSVQRLARAAADAPLLPLQLASALSADRRSRVAATRWADEAAAAARTLSTIGLEGSAALAGTTARLPLGLEFVELAGGDAVLGGEARASRGGDIPRRVTLAPYSIAITETPYSAYRAFVAANPAWSADNRSDLMERGLVDEEYLADVERLERDPSLPVTGVSVHAATAFAEWYTTLLGPGATARLPSEAEWEFALAVSAQAEGVFASAAADGPVRVGEAGSGRAGITGLVGNVWEMTGDSFAPYAFVYPAAPGLPAAHRVVRGGGWGTESVGFQPGDRGSIDPSWCSPFIGFRLVVSPAAP